MTTMHRTDAQLKDAIQREMAWTPSVDGAHIGVSVRAGAVTLSGQVDTYPERSLAESAALRVRGVHAVADEITVRDAATPVNDSDIAREAGEALERAVDVPADSVKATVHHGVVTLSGVASWQYQRLAAARVVHHLRGVRSVLNCVSIRPTVSPRDLKAGIDEALARDAQLDHADVGVRSDAGHVTLTGVVDTWADATHAESLAWSSPGVVAVTNELTVAR